MSQELTAKATLKELRLAPRKVSLVASLVRGRSVEDAIVILNNTPKRAAKPLLKLIENQVMETETYLVFYFEDQSPSILHPAYMSLMLP